VIEAFAADDVRAAEKVLLAAGPAGALMDRAAAGLAAAVADLLRERRGGVYGARVGLLVGSGDNGGDTLLAGALLTGRGARVEAVLLGRRTHPRGLATVVAAGARVHAIGPGAPDDAAADAAAAVLARVDVLLDGVLGIGARPGLRDPAAAVVTRLLGSRRGSGPVPVVVAVDLPSGTGPDDGAAPEPVLPADLTVSFGCAKPAHLVPPAAAVIGRLRLVPLESAGVALRPHLPPVPAVARLEPADVAARWPVPARRAHKYTRGVVGVVAGGEQYPGAAALAVEAAVGAGAPMVRYVGPPGPTRLVQQRRPEVVPGTGRVQAWVLGPGVDPQDDEQTSHVREALLSGVACVVDAGALAVVADLVTGGAGAQGPAPPGRRWLLTPHAGELATLLTAAGRPAARGDVEAAPLPHAAAVAGMTGACVLLKGPVTLVVPPGAAEGRNGPVWSQAEAPAWMATAGSGDVLAGLAGMLLAARAASSEVSGSGAGVTSADLAEVGAMAASVHGLAGRLASGGGPVAALAVAQALAPCIAGLLAEA